MDKPPVYSRVFDADPGEIPYGKRTICEVHCDIYDLCAQGLHRENPQLLTKIVRLLEEAYGMGKRMNAKLVLHKDGMDDWAKTYDPIEYAEQLASRRRRIAMLRGSADPESK